MEEPNKHNVKNQAAKLCMSLMLISSSLYVSHASCKEGLSASRQAELINSLENYKPLNSDVDLSQKISGVDLQNKNEYCDQEEYSKDKYCLERRYMKGAHYIVTISFSREANIPVQPSAPHIKGSKPFKRDTRAREAFLMEWKDAIATEYLGSNYGALNSVEVSGSHPNAVVLNLEVSEASQLTNVLTDPRILRVTHIGSPPPQLEEITP